MAVKVELDGVFGAGHLDAAQVHLDAGVEAPGGDGAAQSLAQQQDDRRAAEGDQAEPDPGQPARGAREVSTEAVKESGKAAIRKREEERDERESEEPRRKRSRSSKNMAARL